MFNKFIKVSLATLAVGFSIESTAHVSRLNVAAAAKPVDIYAQLPRTASVQVSPDGRYLAMLSPYKGSKGVFIYNLADPSAKVSVIPTPKNSIVKGVTWGSNKHVIMQGQSRHFYGGGGKLRKYAVLHYRWYATNVETQKTVMLMRDKIADEQKNYQVVYGGNYSHQLPDDEEHILMSFSEYTNRPVTRYWRVNLDKGKSRQIKTLPYETERVIRSNNGEDIIARSQYFEKSGKFSVFSGEYPDEKEIYTEAFNSDENPTTFLQTISDGKLILTKDVGTKYEWFTLDPKTGAQGSFQPNADIPDGYEYSPMFDPYTDDLIGVTYTDDLRREVYISEPYKSWHTKASKALKGRNVSILSRTEDNKMVTLFAESPGNAGEYYLFEPALGQISPLGGAYPELSSKDIGRTTRVNFAARDGLNIPAYLTLPPGKTKTSGPMPLVVMPHGGPAARDDAAFDFWAQFIASRGYAVFKPQFRGSTGFGYSHTRKGDGNFGDAMLTDTVDGVNYLIDQNIVDPNKICVTGASYGGYQALALPMIEPDMFKCALSVNGVSDIPDMLDYVIATGGREGSSKIYWDRVMGVDIGGMERLSAQSPADNADKIKAEIVLVHGEDDGTVPLQQAEAMEKALKKIGRKSDIIVLKDDDHNLSLPQSRKTLLEVSEQLFERHLK